MSKLKEKVAGKCKDMGLSDAVIEGLIAAMQGDIKDDSTDEAIEAKAEEIAKIAKLTQGEATRWAAKKTNKDDDKGGAGRSEDEPKPADISKLITEAVAAATKPLAEQIQSLQGAAITTGRREKVAKMLEGASENVKKMVLDGFDNRSFADDSAFDTYFKDTEATVTAMKKEMSDASLRGGGGRPSMGKAGDDGISEAVAAYVKDTADGASQMGGKKL